MDLFTLAYIYVALWSTIDDNGSFLNENYYMDDISEETLKEMVDDCKKFQSENKKLLEGLDPEQAGHDFWLTRNHHGAGFWDRGYGKLGDKLTKESQKYKEINLYVGDDGKIYS